MQREGSLSQLTSVAEVSGGGGTPSADWPGIRDFAEVKLTSAQLTSAVVGGGLAGDRQPAQRTYSNEVSLVIEDSPLAEVN